MARRTLAERALLAIARRIDTGYVSQPVHKCDSFAACKNGCALGRRIAL